MDNESGMNANSEELNFEENLDNLPKDLMLESTILNNQILQEQQKQQLLLQQQQQQQHQHQQNRIPSISNLHQQQPYLSSSVSSSNQLASTSTNLLQQGTPIPSASRNQIQGQSLPPLQSIPYTSTTIDDNSRSGRGRPKKARGGAGGRVTIRGKPKRKVNKGGNGFSNKRRRGESSDSEDLELDLEENDETKTESEKGKESSDLDGEGESDDEMMQIESKKRDMGQEMPDDFNPADDPARKGPTTKFGRKISKPAQFIPAARSAPPKKKKIIPIESFLMCQECNQGHSPLKNSIVICEVCEKGWHQLCHEPNILEGYIDTDLPWNCKTCDIKLALSKPPVDVEIGEWTIGNDGVIPYSVEEKKEWLEGIPLHSLIGYILSIEKKFTVVPFQGLPIWPSSLSKTLDEIRARKNGEIEERKSKEEAVEAAETAALLEIEREERESKLAKDAMIKAKAAAKAQERIEARTAASAKQQEILNLQQQQQALHQQRQIMQPSLSQSSNSRPQSPHSPPVGTSPYFRNLPLSQAPLPMQNHPAYYPTHPNLLPQQQQQQQQSNSSGGSYGGGGGGGGGGNLQSSSNYPNSRPGSASLPFNYRNNLPPISSIHNNNNNGSNNSNNQGNRSNYPQPLYPNQTNLPPNQQYQPYSSGNNNANSNNNSNNVDNIQEVQNMNMLWSNVGWGSNSSDNRPNNNDAGNDR